jgi:hypothetical protein
MASDQEREHALASFKQKLIESEKANLGDA